MGFKTVFKKVRNSKISKAFPKDGNDVSLL